MNRLGIENCLRCESDIKSYSIFSVETQSQEAIQEGWEKLLIFLLR